MSERPQRRHAVTGGIHDDNSRHPQPRTGTFKHVFDLLEHLKNVFSNRRLAGIGLQIHGMPKSVMYENLFQAAHHPPEHGHLVLLDPFLRPQRLSVPIHVVTQKRKPGWTSFEIVPVRLPKRHLAPQQKIRYPQVLQLPKELVQSVVLVVVTTEMLQSIPQRTVGRSCAPIQCNQRQRQNPQTFPFQDELPCLEQRHARVVLVLPFHLHRREALEPNLFSTVILARELPQRVPTLPVSIHPLLPIGGCPPKTLPLLKNHLGRLSCPAQMDSQCSDDLEPTARGDHSFRFLRPWPLNQFSHTPQKTAHRGSSTTVKPATIPQTASTSSATRKFRPEAKQRVNVSTRKESS